VCLPQLYDKPGNGLYAFGEMESEIIQMIIIRAAQRIVGTSLCFPVVSFSLLHIMSELGERPPPKVY